MAKEPHKRWYWVNSTPVRTLGSARLTGEPSPEAKKVIDAYNAKIIREARTPLGT